MLAFRIIYIIQNIGEGRVHECLRSHRDELGDTCRKEELLLEEQEAETVELRPGIMKVWNHENVELVHTKNVETFPHIFPHLYRHR